MHAPNTQLTHEITLSNGLLSLTLLPELAGGIARFDWIAGGVARPVFRPRAQSANPLEPNTLGCYTMLPWANRIADGRFHFAGAEYTVARTRADEALPIHGNAAFAPWAVIADDERSAEFYQRHDAADPYTFEAWQRYQISGNRLSITVSIRNLGQRLPFGAGIHPFFARTPDTQLIAPATGLWQCDANYLPTQLVTPEASWDFSSLALLPEHAINNAYVGWTGRAAIHQRELHIDLACDANYYVLYTPLGQNFFCFEPSDHPVNALNLGGGAAANGMTILDRGQTLSHRFHFTVHEQ